MLGLNVVWCLWLIVLLYFCSLGCSAPFNYLDFAELIIVFIVVWCCFLVWFASFVLLLL